MGDNSHPLHVQAKPPHMSATISRKHSKYVFISKYDRPILYQETNKRSQKYQVYTDPYTKMTRLDLYAFDGKAMNPMFLAYSPPQMLPTVTMNPTATSTASKAKRTVGLGEELEEPLNKHALHIKRSFEQPLLHRIDLNMLWWAGLGMTLFGGAAYLL